MTSVDNNVHRGLIFAVPSCGVDSFFFFFICCAQNILVPLLVYCLLGRKIEGARKPDMYEIIKTDLSESIHHYTSSCIQPCRVLFSYRRTTF